MNRPLTGRERASGNRRAWYLKEQEQGIAKRGERGAMEFWLRFTRSWIAKETKAGRVDVLAGFTLVCRAFTAAMQQRAAGDPRVWKSLLEFMEQIVRSYPLRD
ncbi:hypothetical protein [Streptomyces sp. MNP-20]|uniref:hypothetical protein n=1 Tax=Streptomyces sp. MNP-20 TaxID=2721165 RepID=UPI001556641C|nr:hypothetical protein [Streptomyces sp. MNP-20]